MLSTTGTVPVELRETEQFASLKIEPIRNIWHFDKTLHRSCRTRYNISFNINAPININSAGGGVGCGQRVGISQKAEILGKISSGGETNINQIYQWSSEMSVKCPTRRDNIDVQIPYGGITARVKSPAFARTNIVFIIISHQLRIEYCNYYY
jgi:hypothetical protein